MSESQKHYEKLCQLSRKAKIFEGINSLLEWDQETCMPKAAAKIRAEQIQAMAGTVHQLHTGKPFTDALAQLIDLPSGEIKQHELKPEQQAALQRWRHDYLLATSLPQEFVERFARTTSEAHIVWEQAKKKNDFSLFLPTLEKIIDLNRQKADYHGYADHPYDALLETYEPGMTRKEVAEVFTPLKKSTVELLAKIRNAEQVDASKLTVRYSPAKQLSFGHKLTKMIGYSSDKGRLDLSTHPFSSASHPTDSRITTRIIPNLPVSNIRSILHECGHAFYEMGLPEEHYGTPLGEAISLGVHESQSRWWETHIGMSKGFWTFLMPHMKKHFKGKLDDIGLESLWRAANKVEPTLIRVEADEVTYALHIILRFELESALIEGTLAPKDVPEAWNQKMAELLGITPSTDSEGCLQDVHWSMGAFGYFPTYALGNLYAAQFFEAFKNKHPDWEERVEKGDFSFIRKWLTEHIHIHGRRYSSRELLKKVSGKDFTSKPFENYLNEKFSTIYRL